MEPTIGICDLIAKAKAILLSRPLSLLSLMVVLHFIAWRFVDELIMSIHYYCDAKFHRNLIESLGLSSDLQHTMSEFLTFALHFVLMQISIAALMPRVVSRRAGASDDHQAVVDRFKRAEFLLGMLRSLCILLVFIPLIWIAVAVATLLTLFLVFLASVQGLQPSPEWQFRIMASLALLLTAYITARGSISIPMSLAENTTVKESLQRSWRMTTKCWTVISSTNLLFFVGAGCLIYMTAGDPEESVVTAILWWLMEIFVVTLLAALWVCFYDLLRSEA